MASRFEPSTRLSGGVVWPDVLGKLPCGLKVKIGSFHYYYLDSISRHGKILLWLKPHQYLVLDVVSRVFPSSPSSTGVAEVAGSSMEDLCGVTLALRGKKIARELDDDRVLA